ncbi:MAG: methyltransferase family protein [Candidatus Thorarchaeota archaeon]
MPDLFFRIVFLSIFLAFWVIRFYYVRETRKTEPSRSRAERRAAIKQRGWTDIIIVIFTPIEFVLVLLFVWGPVWMSWADLIFPDWLYWLGTVLTICSLPLIVWVHRTLGTHYSPALETKEEQKLITSGPYGRVRHPLYSAHNLFNLGMIFLTANIPLIFFAIIGVPIVYVRIRDEERMMVEKFGREYEEYKMRTGRIFPKL